MKRDIVKRALAGDNFSDLKIADSHCHMGPWYNFYFPAAGIDEMLHDADIIGIEKLCIAPHAAISCDYRLGNRQASEAADKYPDRVYAMLVLNPNKPEEIRQEFDKYYANGHFAGVKLHPGLHGYNVAGESCMAVYERVRRQGGYVLSHTWEPSGTCSIELCEAVVRTYPGIPFVLGHAGGVRKGVEKSIKLVNTYENAYMDTSGFEFSDTWIEEIVKKADASKILFGSDCPFHDIRGGVSRILLADIDDEVKRLILGANYYNMLSKLPRSSVIATTA